MVQAFAAVGLPAQSNLALPGAPPNAAAQPAGATAGAPALPGAADAFQPAQQPDAAAATQGGGDAQANGLLQGIGKLISQLGDVFKTLGELLQGGGGGGGAQTPPVDQNPNPNPTPPPVDNNPTPPPANNTQTPVQQAMETDMPAKIAAHPDLRKDINAPLNFNITGQGGGQWGVDLRKNSDWVQRGQIANPKATITISADDFMGLRQGKLDGMTLFQQGRIKFEPFDMGVAMKLGDLLK
jgi:hypothetical protein